MATKPQADKDADAAEKAAAEEAEKARLAQEDAAKLAQDDPEGAVDELNTREKTLEEALAEANALREQLALAQMQAQQPQAEAINLPNFVGERQFVTQSFGGKE